MDNKIVRMVPSSGIERRIVHMGTYVSEELIASMLKVENQSSKKPACNRWVNRAISQKITCVTTTVKT
jgi:hypothetical protein